MTTTKTLNPGTPAQNEEKAEVHDDMIKPTAQRKSEVRLAREVQARIGQQLRAMYNDVVNEGVPAHIAELVHRLSDQDDGAA